MDNLPNNIGLTQNQQRIVSLVRYLLGKKVVLILAATVGLVLGGCYAYFKKPVYIGAITFTVQEENKLSGGGLLSLASSFGLDAGGTSGLFSGENLEQVFKSRKMVEKTFLQSYPNSPNKTYADVYIDILNIKGQLKLPDNFSISANQVPQNKRLQDSVIAFLHKFINLGFFEVVRPDKKLDIYEASFKSTNEQFSKSFVEEVLKQVSTFYTETKTRKAKLNVDVLERRVDSIRNALGILVYQKASDADANVNPIFQTPKAKEQTKQIDMTALGAGYGELLKNLELARYTLLKETPLFQIIDEPKFPLKKKNYSIATYGILLSVFFVFVTLATLLGINILKNITKLIKG